VEFDRHCQFRAHDKVWFEKNQNRKSVKEEAYCALTQYAKFLQKLKELDAFENSLIVLKSDHGKPVKYNYRLADKYNDKNNIESFEIRKHIHWGYGRYMPFLAIKDFGPTSPGVIHNHHPVILDDLARTLCVHSSITADCSEYNGYDLLGDDFSGVEMAKVTMFVVKSSKSNHTYDTHEAITIERGMDILENLHEKLSQEYLSSSVSCDKKIEVRDGLELDNGHSDFKSWMTWNHRGSSYLRFKQNPECTNTRLLLNGSQTGIKNEELAIVVNGQQIKVRIDRNIGENSENDDTYIVNIPSEITNDFSDVLIKISPRSPKPGEPIQILATEFIDSLKNVAFE
jgi:hypothetical protein